MSAGVGKGKITHYTYLYMHTRPLWNQTSGLSSSRATTLTLTMQWRRKRGYRGQTLFFFCLSTLFDGPCSHPHTPLKKRPQKQTCGTMTHDPWTINHGPWPMTHEPWTMTHEPWTTNHGPHFWEFAILVLYDQYKLHYIICCDFDQRDVYKCTFTLLKICIDWTRTLSRS